VRREGGDLPFFVVVCILAGKSVLTTPFLCVEKVSDQLNRNSNGKVNAAGYFNQFYTAQQNLSWEGVQSADNVATVLRSPTERPIQRRTL